MVVFHCVVMCVAAAAAVAVAVCAAVCARRIGRACEALRRQESATVMVDRQCANIFKLVRAVAENRNSIEIDGLTKVNLRMETRPERRLRGGTGAADCGDGGANVPLADFDIADRFVMRRIDNVSRQEEIMKRNANMLHYHSVIEGECLYPSEDEAERDADHRDGKLD